MKIPRLRNRVVIALAVGVLMGLVVGRGCSLHLPVGGGASIHSASHEAQPKFWTCSMHPQIQKPGPGPCPLCGMDLIPVMSGPAGESDSQREVILSATARRLAQIETTPVERRSVAVELRMVGKVQVDETRLATIAPRVDGRIDRLMANYTGMAVHAGDPLADLYSPEWVATQQELLQAVKAAGTSEASSSLLQATRERLRLWGVSPRQIEEIEERGQVSDHVTFVSPIGGIVVNLAAREGEYVKTGMPLFTIADLSRVWVELDAYESDLGQIRVGQPVTFTAEAVPGEAFSGTVAFIHPVLNPMTRTVKVRVDAENAAGRLKPEYFVRAVVQAPVVEEGVELPLVIPASAPLLTGRRAVVYVQNPEQEGTYEGREVVLGPRAGEFYIVQSGLKEGEDVVTRGAFKLDAELQLHAKPSMMNPEGGGGGGMPGMDHGMPKNAVHPQPKPSAPAEGKAPANRAFSTELQPLVASYLDIQQALSSDQYSEAAAAAVDALSAVEGVDMGLLKGPEHRRWMQQASAVKAALVQLTEASDIQAFRNQFSPLSDAMADVLTTFPPTDEPLYLFHCPMAMDNQGADWLQDNKQTANPYYGASMMRCGAVTRQLGAESETGMPSHE